MKKPIMSKRGRRFGEGGATDELEAANASEDSQEIAGEAALKGMRDSASAPAPKDKSRVVSKAELEKSGMSLRDFLNKEQGLTRRGGPASAAPAKAASSKAESAPAKAASAAETKSERKSAVDQIPLDAPRTPARGEKVDSTELGRNVSNALNAMAGPASGLGALFRTAQTASKFGSRALAAAETPVTYLGRSGGKQVGGFGELEEGARRALTNSPTRQLAAPPRQLPSPRGGGTEQAAADVVAKARKAKKVLDESDLTGGAIGYKKGGNVRGWGMARGARAAKMR